MPQTILVVDDAENLRVLLKNYLAQEGYRVVTAGDGRQALFVARDERPDLIILDLMMPELSGYDFMRHYSREGDAPIIVLTARMEEDDRVLGLELGADDYVTKPFSMRELAARVRAVLRRAGKATPQVELLRAGPITLDRPGRQVHVGDRPVRLTPSEFDLLSAFMSEPGRAFTRADLLDLLQGSSYEGYERTIDVHIRNLRRKIEPNPASPVFIETVYGHGYRFSLGA